ncbi:MULTISPECIES: TetR/AcrR family transcriptional regulator [unclassified Amycolatopsis]|uniref:TetR/AcrR family transcriptional regulator n=1 Tax=unclassified Amycolatopsis TaxID=2618356 RepID=UPI00129066F3|nr:MULTISPECIES: TetR/AcrR family transcriptional regulator [unclassified Amycolatopsis]MBN6037166.1 TetR family transcriptional regulator [Amycolatopsis sp. 195334CR]QFU93132.1 Transcriptional regulator, TetR family [Amycolatopsis sp. YIM 10]
MAGAPESPSPLPGQQRPRSRFAAGLPAVTAERIVDAALRLTVERGLDSWTLRQLASAVEAYPAVIYHHVGDRESVVRAVIERVGEEIPLPDANLHWRDFYWQLLADLRVVLRRYPGVARRFSLYGPLIPSIKPLIDRGVRVLQRDGFGEESVTAYNLLLGTAAALVSKEDDHLAQPLIKPDSPEVYAEARDREDLPGLAALGRNVYERVKDPERLAAHFTEFYEYSVQIAIDGLERRLTRIHP